MDFGEESNVRDRPIYLLVEDADDASNCFWYVIEENDADQILKRKIEEEVNETFGKKKKDHICVLMASETEEIEELQLPRLDSYTDVFFIFNSRIYVLGGNTHPKDENFDFWNGYSKSVVYLDTKDVNKCWLKGPSLNARRRALSVAILEKSGLFFSFGMGTELREPVAEILDDSLNGGWFPVPPPEHFNFYDGSLLAVTDTKVYIHGFGAPGVRMGLCFDVENSEWTIFDCTFDGVWYPGVVLEFCSNSYLFLYGRKSTQPTFTGVKGKPTFPEEFCVYDLNNCKWLPFAIDLPEDGTVLPDHEGKQSAQKYLLQMNQRNKLALVWSATLYTLLDPGPVESVCKINCTKFFINCTTPDTDPLHPIFSANVVSFGSYHIKKGNWLLSCAA